MPKVEIEIMRVREVYYAEQGIIELNVPQSVLDSGDIESWIKEKYKGDDFRKMIDEEMCVEDMKESINWESAENLT